MRVQVWSSRLLVSVGLALCLSASGCKTLSERYIALEVWKYERCFGHLPPGFVPPGVAAQPAPRVCGQGAPCASATPCAGAETMAGDNCNACQGGTVEGHALPAGTTILPGGSAPLPAGTTIQGGTILPGGAGAPVLPSGPGGAPGPVPSASLPTSAVPVSTSRPVVISDEVVLP